jgi:hypothetical protein
MGRAYSAHGGERKCIWDFGGKATKKKETLRRPRRRREDGNKMDLREIGWSGIDWKILV